MTIPHAQLGDTGILEAVMALVDRDEVRRHAFDEAQAKARVNEIKEYADQEIKRLQRVSIRNLGLVMLPILPGDVLKHLRSVFALYFDMPEVECHGHDTNRQVFFYEPEFYVLSNFSAFAIDWEGHRFSTSEHAYQWDRFQGRELGIDAAHVGEMIRTAPSAHLAFSIAQQNKALQRSDWNSIKVSRMRQILNAKVKQHEYVRRKLMETGRRELVEDAWRDSFWGSGADGRGENHLGKLWMEIRSSLS